MKTTKLSTSRMKEMIANIHLPKSGIDYERWLRENFDLVSDGVWVRKTGLGSQAAAARLPLKEK